MFLAESSIQLVPDGTLLLHLLLIGIMVAVLNRTLLKPINKILADRENLVSSKLTEAQAITADAEQKLKEYNLTLREARTEGYQFLEKERGAAVKQKEEKVRAAKEEITKSVANEVEALRQQEGHVRQELEVQAASIGDLISSQVLRRN
jgi:F-type H+-transporting ATPase subunit b